MSGIPCFSLSLLLLVLAADPPRPICSKSQLNHRDSRRPRSIMTIAFLWPLLVLPWPGLLRLPLLWPGLMWPGLALPCVPCFGLALPVQPCSALYLHGFQFYIASCVLLCPVLASLPPGLLCLALPCAWLALAWPAVLGSVLCFPGFGLACSAFLCCAYHPLASPARLALPCVCLALARLCSASICHGLAWPPPPCSALCLPCFGLALLHACRSLAWPAPLPWFGLASALFCSVLALLWPRLATCLSWFGLACSASFCHVLALLWPGLCSLALCIPWFGLACSVFCHALVLLWPGLPGLALPCACFALAWPRPAPSCSALCVPWPRGLRLALPCACLALACCASPHSASCFLGIGPVCCALLSSVLTRLWSCSFLPFPAVLWPGLLCHAICFACLPLARPALLCSALCLPCFGLAVHALLWHLLRFSLP